jgi:hypothetical protein
MSLGGYFIFASHQFVHFHGHFDTPDADPAPEANRSTIPRSFCPAILSPIRSLQRQPPRLNHIQIDLAEDQRPPTALSNPLLGGENRRASEESDRGIECFGRMHRSTCLSFRKVAMFDGNGEPRLHHCSNYSIPIVLYDDPTCCRSKSISTRRQ